MCSSLVGFTDFPAIQLKRYTQIFDLVLCLKNRRIALMLLSAGDEMRKSSIVRATYDVPATM